MATKNDLTNLILAGSLALNGIGCVCACECDPKTRIYHLDFDGKACEGCERYDCKQNKEQAPSYENKANKNKTSGHCNGRSSTGDC